MTRVAVGQVVQPIGVGAAVSAACDLADQAHGQGADLLVLPECFLGGYHPNRLRLDPSRAISGVEDTRLAPIREKARRCELSLLIGAAIRESDGRISNALLWVDRDDGIRIAYRKVHLWRDERMVFTPGQVVTTVDHLGLRIGLGICYDAGFPEFVRHYGDADANVIVFASAFARGDEELRYGIYHPARAVEASAYVAVSNALGVIDDTEYFGASGVWAPDGRQIASARGDPGVVTIAIDPVRAQAARENVGYDSVRASVPALSPSHLAIR